uniref:Knottin scorpion toxin-like domain-containing protein n=2 Tax=Zea mays TaxID=4577 RepID=A0A804P222_MAIZE
MDPKYVSLCIFVLLVLHGDTTLAETCREFAKWHPFCFSAMCKANCFIEGKSSDGSYAKGYRCDSHGFHSMCICLLCKS